MADPYAMLDELSALVQTVPALKDRTEGAADLAELLAQKAFPNTPATAFVVPLGLRPRSEGEAATGAFIQSIDESFGVVLVLRTAGDLTGRKSLPKLNELIWAVVVAVAGGDVEGAVGVFRLVRAQTLKLGAGVLIAQVDFAIELQLRNL